MKNIYFDSMSVAWISSKNT